MQSSLCDIERPVQVLPDSTPQEDSDEGPPPGRQTTLIVLVTDCATSM